MPGAAISRSCVCVCATVGNFARHVAPTNIFANKSEHCSMFSMHSARGYVIYKLVTSSVMVTSNVFGDGFDKELDDLSIYQIRNKKETNGNMQLMEFHLFHYNSCLFVASNIFQRKVHFYLPLAMLTQIIQNGRTRFGTIRDSHLSISATAMCMCVFILSI